MNKVLVLIVVMFIVATSIVSAQAPVFGGDKRPSYFELDDYNHRYPETDTNVKYYMNNWRDSQITIGHGGFFERAYLTPGDPTNPPSPGAVLKYIKAYNHGTLEAGSRTLKTMHEKEQVFFYITSGIGKVEAGGKNAEIWETGMMTEKAENTIFIIKKGELNKNKRIIERIKDKN